MPNEPRSFWPQEDDDTIYISESARMSDILARINEKWSGVDMGKIEIGADHIHTECLGYDRYDPSDYTDFIIVRRLTE